jgi:hypothetical protein
MEEYAEIDNHDIARARIQQLNTEIDAHAPCRLPNHRASHNDANLTHSQPLSPRQQPRTNHPKSQASMHQAE